MPLPSSLTRKLLEKLTKKPAKRLRKPQQVLQRNLSTIPEDIEPLLPDSPASTIGNPLPGKLSDDPAIFKFVLESEEESRQDQRHSTKIPVETLEEQRPQVQADILLQQHTKLEHELRTTQSLLHESLYENEQLGTELENTSADLALAHDQLHDLKIRNKSLAGTQGWIRTRLREKIAQLSILVEEKQNIIEGKETMIKWLGDDLEKARRSEKGLARKCEVLWEQVEKLKRERARREGDGEGRMFFT